MPETRPAADRGRIFRIGGVSVDAVHLGAAVDRFFEMTRSGEGGYVCVASSHGIVDAQKDARLKSIMNDARLVVPDGMPLSVVGRIRIGSEVGRVPGAEFFQSILSDSRGADERHFFYGSAPETVDAVVARATDNLGTGAIAGQYCPPFRAAGAMETDDVIAEIAATRPTVIWVGLSTPKQEYWMANHAAKFPGVICVGVGAAFDFFAGTKGRGPVVLQKAGLEWMYRLSSEPARLWPRYRYVVPSMLGIMTQEFLAPKLGKNSDPN